MAQARSNPDRSHLLVPDATERDYDPERLGKLVARLDSTEFGPFLDALVAVDGPAWWERFAQNVSVGEDAQEMLASLTVWTKSRRTA